MVQITLIVLFSVLTGVGWVLAVRSQPRYRREQDECCHALGLHRRVDALEERIRKLEAKGGMVNAGS